MALEGALKEQLHSLVSVRHIEEAMEELVQVRADLTLARFAHYNPKIGIFDRFEYSASSTEPAIICVAAPGPVQCSEKFLSQLKIKHPELFPARRPRLFVVPKGPGHS